MYSIEYIYFVFKLKISMQSIYYDTKIQNIISILIIDDLDSKILLSPD